jgi:hypothetical protein
MRTVSILGCVGDTDAAEEHAIQSSVFGGEVAGTTFV